MFLKPTDNWPKQLPFQQIASHYCASGFKASNCQKSWAILVRIFFLRLLYIAFLITIWIKGFSLTPIFEHSGMIGRGCYEHQNNRHGLNPRTEIQGFNLPELINSNHEARMVLLNGGSQCARGFHGPVSWCYAKLILRYFSKETNDKNMTFAFRVDGINGFLVGLRYTD